MTETDFGTFDRAFGRVCGAFRLKLKPSEAEELTRTYFRVLERFPIEEVLLAGKQCLAKYRAFPKAADWITELTTTSTPLAAGVDVRHMGAGELEDSERAHRLRYVDHPCLCSECCRAGVDDQPIRYVPTLVGDVEERAFNPRRQVIQVVGHWAHGEELRRWYEARAKFFAAGGRYPRVVQMIAREREPGEDG